MSSVVGRFAVRHAVSILFLLVVACAGGVYAALYMPSSIFPQVNFPRVVILVANGVMPADQMMASVTRPIEEAMKQVPGCRNVRSATGRGTAEIDIFFPWSVDMVQSEHYVNSRLGSLRSTLPPTAEVSAQRMTFAAFPVIGISLTSPTRQITSIWESAQYQVKPRLLRLHGVADVQIVGGAPPEFKVLVDPARLAGLKLGLEDVTAALRRNNLISGAGLREQGHEVLLTVVDGRVRTPREIGALAVATPSGMPVPLSAFAVVERSSEPSFNRVTADGQNAVLLNVFAQPDASTIDIAEQVEAQRRALRAELPSDIKVRLFYDQSLLVRSSLRGVWEAVGFGLLLSVAILYLFLRDWGSTLIATAVIPVAVLLTVLVMFVTGMSFNLMTLGGIAAAIGLVIDDAIVVVEAIYSKMATGLSRIEAVQTAVPEILSPLLGSTLTPVVVFIPLAFLDGITGTFFRALALTMTAALLASLLLALTLTPSLAAWIVQVPPGERLPEIRQAESGGFFLRLIIRAYEVVVVRALRHRWFTVTLCILALLAAVALYRSLDSNFLPAMNEEGFVIDYIAPPGSSLTEIDRQMLQAEKMLSDIPEIESFSRRTGTALGVQLVEPNTGDFLVKLRPGGGRSTEQVIAAVREKFNVSFPRTQWDFPGILSDLIGDLTLADQPIQVRLFSTDLDLLHKQARRVELDLKKIPGVVDVLNGIIATGRSIDVHVRHPEAQYYGLNADDIATAVNIAMLGQTASSVLEGDRVINIRVQADPHWIAGIDGLRNLPLRATGGRMVPLGEVAAISQTAGEYELHRDDLRQDIEIDAELEGRDLGSTMAQIRQTLGDDPALRGASIEYAGTYQQQQESFRNLLVVLAAAIGLVFLVALMEFRSFSAPISIVFGAVLSTLGIVVALKLTHTSLSVVAYLGAIIGMGIVHKNGILMLDYVEHLRQMRMSLEEALVFSGRRRLRPVLMTSMAAAMGMLPLAYGIGSGATCFVRWQSRSSGRSVRQSSFP